MDYKERIAQEIYESRPKRKLRPKNYKDSFGMVRCGTIDKTVLTRFKL